MGGRWPVWFLIISVGALLAVAFSGTGAAQGVKSPGVQALSPFQRLVSWMSGATGYLVETIGSGDALAEDNRQLRRQVLQLQNEVIRLQEAGVENRQLRALLNYERGQPGWEYLTATIIAYDPSNLVHSFVIDRGMDDGVQAGMIVVAELGLLGKVVEAFPSVAKVLLITDPSSVVTALLQRSRVNGIATGRSDHSLDLRYVDKNVDIVPGELVLTSGLGGGFPKGVPLGRVAQIIDKDQALFIEIRLQPLASVASLRNVLVITDFTPIELP